MSSSALAAGLRHLRGKLAAQQKRDDSDEQLLHAFTSRRDDQAFAVLVRRHGPMVLNVCRRVLGHEQDAEDAFQATFLVLARNATSLRNKASLASFLYGIAYRTALKAKQAAACRRKYERSLRALTQPRSPTNPADELSWREAKCLLDAEIVRLPEIYRVVFVHFYLQDHSQAETARWLGLKVATVEKRLAEARKRLRQRLRRHGVELTAVLAAWALATRIASALPDGLMTTTIKAVSAMATCEGFAGNVSVHVIELVEGAAASMLLTKAKIAAVALLLVATSGSLVGLYRWASGPLAATMELPAAKADDKPHVASPKREMAETVSIQGRVVDPDGKPVRGARLYLPELKGEQIRPLAMSDAEGRFRFQVMPAAVQLTPLSREPWRYIYVVAVAEGHGPGIAAVGDPAQADKLTLRLVKDDVAIKGRVLDLQG